MCCRCHMEDHDPELAQILGIAIKSPLISRIQKVRPTPLVQSGEVFPTNLVAAIASDKQRNAAIFPMIWGFTAQGRSAPIINARVESAGEKPTFREAWKEHRCAIPVSWYYEWQHLPSPDGRSTIKTKYAIQPREAGVTWLCGLYRLEDGIPVFVILTREPSEGIAHIHDRMPLILPKTAIRDWVNPCVKAEDMMRYAVTDLIAEKAKE